MRSKLVNLSKRPFVRNVIILASGTAAAQAVAMVLSPIITRLYGPEAYGILGVFTAVISIFVPISALSYPIAIVLPKKDNEAKGIIKLSCFISITIAILLTIVLIFFNNALVQMFNLQVISSFLFFIPIVILFSGILQVTEQWLIRKKQFRVSAKVTLVQSILIQGGKVGLGLIKPFATTLIIITVFGQILKPLLMMLFVRKSKQDNLVLDDEEDNKYELKEIAKKYKDFPIYRAPETFISAVSMGLPTIMLTVFFGPASAGFYSLGRTVLSAPSQLLGKSVTDVFYPRIAEASKNGEDLFLLVKKATLALAAIGLIPYALIILFSPHIFGIIFGPEWDVAGEYTRWIAIWSYLGFMNRPSVAAIPVLSAQMFFLYYSITSLAIRLGALVFGYLVFSSDLIAVALFSVTSALSNVLLIQYTLRRSRCPK